MADFPSVWCRRIDPPQTCEDLIVQEYADGIEATAGISVWMTFDNTRRRRQAGGRTKPSRWSRFAGAFQWLPFKPAAADASPAAPNMKASLGRLGELPALARDWNWAENSPPHSHYP